MRGRVWAAATWLVVAALATAARAEDKPDAFAQALKAPPDEQRKLVFGLAVAGDVRAAARMIDLEMWDDMVDMPFGTPPNDCWLTTPGEFSGMTGAQVHGCVEQNWAFRHKRELGDALAARLIAARAHMESAPVKSPALGMELAWSWHDFEPKDEPKARAIEDGWLPFVEDPPPTLDALVRASRVARFAERRADEHDRLVDFARGAELAGRAAMLFSEAGDKLGQAWMLDTEARCREPVANQPGDWSRPAALYECAAALW